MARPQDPWSSQPDSGRYMSNGLGWWGGVDSMSGPCANGLSVAGDLCCSSLCVSQTRGALGPRGHVSGAG